MWACQWVRSPRAQSWATACVRAVCALRTVPCVPYVRCRVRVRRRTALSTVQCGTLWDPWALTDGRLIDNKFWHHCTVSAGAAQLARHCVQTYQVCASARVPSPSTTPHPSAESVPRVPRVSPQQRPSATGAPALAPVTLPSPPHACYGSLPPAALPTLAARCARPQGSGPRAQGPLAGSQQEIRKPALKVRELVHAREVVDLRTDPCQTRQQSCLHVDAF